MTGRWLPPIYFSYLAGCLYAALTMIHYWYGYQGPWIDRVIVFEIFLTALYTVTAMTFKTELWTRRGLGIWGFMGAIVVSYVVSQGIEWGYLSFPVPQYIVNLYRSPLALGGLFMLYGYYRWTRHDGWDDEVQRDE
jgi:hypothetical protein